MIISIIAAIFLILLAIIQAVFRYLGYQLALTLPECSRSCYTYMASSYCFEFRIYVLLN